MALTPEDVVKKEFPKPKGFGRGGYDEIHVDDFLDEIVVELRRLNAENDKLGQDLDDCRAGSSGTKKPVSEAATVPGLTPVAPATEKDGGAAAAADPAAVKAAEDKLAAARRDTAAAEDARRKAVEGQRQAEQRLTELKNAIAKAEADEKAARQRAADAAKAADEAAQAQPAPAAAVAEKPAEGASPEAAGLVAGGAGGAAGVIALAQKLHDEHVQEGQKTKDRLVAEGDEYKTRVIGEGNAKRDELIANGQNRHDQLVKDAETKKSKIIGDLEREQEQLQSVIGQLRDYESGYRGRLKTFIGEQLKVLDAPSLEGDVPDVVAHGGKAGPKDTPQQG